MHIHYFQHDDFEDLAHIADWAQLRGFSTSVTRFDLEPVYPDFESFDWLIILGGKMDAYGESQHPWLLQEKQFIKEAIQRNKVVLGICLGSQLIAAALGANVYRNSEPESGFFPVYFNENARQDKVFSLLGPKLDVLHVHNDTFDLPEGAVLMASSELTPNQAFRFGQHVFALQFHFEVTKEDVPMFMDPARVPAGRWMQPTSTVLERAVICEQNNLLLRNMLDKIYELKRQEV